MKYLILLYLTFTGGLMAYGQLPDFPLHANGLLYDETLMSRLRHLADSVRSRVKQAGTEGDYYSPKQTTARLVRVDTGDIYGAFNDLKRGISFEAFVRKYPQTEGTSDPYVFAFYLDSVPIAVQLPETAAGLIRYRNLMMDTSVAIYYKDARLEDLRFSPSTFGPAQNVFDNYIDRKGDSAVGIYRRTHAYEHPRNALMEDFLVKRRYIDSLAVDTTFKRLLATAGAEVREKKYRPFIYLERYMDAYSPEAALDIRRSWQEVATCGMDHLTHRPYVMHIAYLAAETGNWPVFLQAQLSVAVDPDGQFPDSSRPGYRSTFLRELEELNIGVDDILLGNELTSPWPDPSFSRARELGRTLALEGGDRHRLEETVLQLIEDNGLDTYHRLDMHYLFLNYESFLPAGSERSKALMRLEKADKTLPDYLSATVKVQERDVNDRASLRP